MNQKFTIQGAEFNNVNIGVSAKLGEITIEVTDLNLVEYIQLVKAVPAVAKEIGTTIQELIERHDEFSLNHAREVADFEQEQRERHMNNMPSFMFGFEGCGCEDFEDEYLPFKSEDTSNDDDDDGINDEELATTKPSSDNDEENPVGKMKANRR